MAFRTVSREKTVFYFDFNETPTTRTNPPSKLNEITWGWSKQNIKTSSIVIVRRLFGAKAHTSRGLKIRKLIRQIFAIFFFANQTSRKMLVVAVRRELREAKMCYEQEEMRKNTSFGELLGLDHLRSLAEFQKNSFSSCLSLSRARAKSKDVERKKRALCRHRRELWYPKKFAARCRKVLFTLPSDDSARIGRPRKRRKAHFRGSCRVAVVRRKKITHELSCNEKIFISLSPLLSGFSRTLSLGVLENVATLHH